jgi:hypothetical protein
MQAALKAFAVDDKSVAPYVYHVLLGHEMDPVLLNVPPPSRYGHAYTHTHTHTHTHTQQQSRTERKRERAAYTNTHRQAHTFIHKHKRTPHSQAWGGLSAYVCSEWDG